MNITLKKFKHYPRLRQDTTAFNADVYCEGKLACRASNTGEGEPIDFAVVDQDLFNAMLAYAVTLPPTRCEGIAVPMDLELFVGKLAEDEIIRIKLNRISRKKTVFYPDGDKTKDPWFVVGRGPLANNWIMNKYPNAIIYEPS